MAFNLAPFGRWTLRDKAAQRRLALRWISQLRLASAMITALFVSACARGPITSVTVYDSDFKEVKQLSSSELAQFEQQWSAKTEVETSWKGAGGRHLKLDIYRKNKGARWLYQTTGYIQVLSMGKTPVYKIPEHAAFNELIGVKK